MAERYYSPHAIAGARAVLDGPEGHHLAHVTRARPGDRVVVFDGRGNEYPARVERVARGQVELALGDRAAIDRELPIDFTLAAALPKGDRQRWLVEKLVELGVTRLVPLTTIRSVAQPVDNALDRLRRAVVEASKQCGRNRLMQIAAACDWADWCQSAGDGNTLRALANPGGTQGPMELLRRLVGPPAARALHLAVGPEGGFTPEEAALAHAAGWGLVDLGPRILRVETAASFLASLVAAACHPAGSTAPA